MINILYYNPDFNGVGYYRTIKPAQQINKDYADEIKVEVKGAQGNGVNWNDDEYLKQFQIIHFHRGIVNAEHMPMLMAKLKSLGIVTIMDLDDYWNVSDAHPMKDVIRGEGYRRETVANLKLSDYVTTTTPVYASYIKEHNKNVVVLENAIDDTEEQWQWKPKTDSKFSRILWLGGSSHYADLDILRSPIQRMKDDLTLKGLYQFNLAGFDLRGTVTEMKFNPALEEDLRKLGLLTQQVFNKIKMAQWSLDPVPQIPQWIKDKYRNNAMTKTSRPVDPNNTVWYDYEKIFTTNHSLIKDQGYVNFLKTFNLNDRYPNEIENQPFVRHKTRDIWQFAENYRYADIALAPIKVFGKIKKGKFEDNVSNRFQFAKSNLKVIESAFHKLPLIASQIPTYTFDPEFVDGKNIIFVNPERQEKDWYKKMKMLIQNPNMASDIGEAAYETVKDKYALRTITKKRVEFYKSILK